MRTSLLLLVLGVSASAQAAVVTRGPFLQQTTPTSTRIILRTDVPAHSTLDIEGGPTAEADGTEHILSVSGLTPATEYTYVVKLDGALAGGPYHFRTAPRVGTPQGEKAKIAVIGDQGSGGVEEKKNASVIEQARPDLLLTVGDNSYPKGDISEWEKTFFTPFKAVLPSLTLAPSLGDHEYLTPLAAGYTDAFVLPGNERYYSQDWGNLHVVALDSNCVDPVDAATMDCDPEAMKAWLREDLAKTRGSWRIVTMHRAAVASGRYGSSAKVAQLIPLFEEGGVDLVLQGHNHSYERTWPLRRGKIVQRGYAASDAPVYMTTGGGGDWVYPPPGAQPEWSAMRTAEFQHLLLEMDGDRLRVDAVRSDGSLLDSFTLNKNAEVRPATPAELAEEAHEENISSEAQGVSEGLPGPSGGCASTADAAGAGWLTLLLGGFARARRLRKSRT
jgi:hypothetical protein